MYSGAPHPTYFDTWRHQLERILEITKVPHNLWVLFATVQLEGDASRWWSSLEANPYTTSQSSFIGALCDAFKVHHDPPTPESDPKEDSKDDFEDLKEELVDHIMAEAGELTEEERRHQSWR